MKKVEYKCNMCQEVKPKTDIACMYWKSDMSPQGWVLSDLKVDNSDIHICYECIVRIKNFANKPKHERT
jgi:hypothetical protein